MFGILAHAGEAHEDAASAAAHSASTLNPILALLLFVTAAAAIYLLVRKLTKDSGKALMVLGFLLLVSGFTTYNVSALISVLSITVGILIAGFLALIGLGNSSHEKEAQE